MTTYADLRRPELPGAVELATLVRDTSLDTVAEDFGVSPRSVQSRLNAAGFTWLGEERTTARPTPRPNSGAPVRRDESWMADRACTPEHSELFYPDGPGKAQQEAAAKAMCASCPVRVRCLEWALEWDAATGGESWGIHGGLNGVERDKIRKANK